MRLREQCDLTAQGPADALPGSEDEVQRQLNRSWRVCCADDAKSLRVRPNSVVVARGIQHRVIEHVERLSSDIEMQTLWQRERPPCGKVKVPICSTNQIISTLVAEASERSRHERARVEPVP